MEELELRTVVRNLKCLCVQFVALVWNPAVALSGTLVCSHCLISRMREVTIGVRYAGWRNSRCMPRPTKRIFSIDPPQEDPSILTSTGSGQNAGWPQIQASPCPQCTTVYQRCCVWICSMVLAGRLSRNAPPSISDSTMLRFTVSSRFGWQWKSWGQVSTCEPLSWIEYKPAVYWRKQSCRASDLGCAATWLTRSSFKRLLLYGESSASIMPGLSLK